MDNINELFKPSVAGDDLKLAILLLMNLIKRKLQFPSALEQCNISLIQKPNKPRKNIDSYRGIFRVTIF